MSRVDRRRGRKRGPRRNDYFGPGQQATLEAWRALPLSLTREKAAEELGTTVFALNSVIRNARRNGLSVDRITPEEALEEIDFLAEQGIPWDEALVRVVPNRTPLSRAVRDLRRSA